MKLTLDLSDLAVESFEASVAGDPSQWTAAASPDTTSTEPETVAFCIARWGKPVTVDTSSRCCE